METSIKKGVIESELRNYVDLTGGRRVCKEEMANHTLELYGYGGYHSIPLPTWDGQASTRWCLCSYRCSWTFWFSCCSGIFSCNLTLIYYCKFMHVKSNQIPLCERISRYYYHNCLLMFNNWITPSKRMPVLCLWIPYINGVGMTTGKFLISTMI